MSSSVKQAPVTISLVAALLLATPIACRHGSPNAHVESTPLRAKATLANEAVRESSGLAASRAQPGLLWTLNDSGNPPHLYATNHHGDDLARCEIKEIGNRDWEDLAAFTLDSVDYLLIAEVGDNKAQHDLVVLHIIPEPSFPSASDQPLTAAVTIRIPFRYQDGPRDCEAVAVDPHRREIILISKALPVAYVYVLPLLTSTPAEPLTAERVGTVMLPLVTGMDISPDGRGAIVGTYGDAYEYIRRDGQSWADALAQPPRRLDLPRVPQCEAICYSLDGRAIHLTSERLPTPLWTIPLYPESGANSTP